MKLYSLSDDALLLASTLAIVSLLAVSWVRNSVICAFDLYVWGLLQNVFTVHRDATGVRISFFFQVEEQSHVCLDHVLFVHLAVENLHVYILHLWALVNNAALFACFT